MKYIQNIKSIITVIGLLIVYMIFEFIAPNVTSDTIDTLFGNLIGIGLVVALIIDLMRYLKKK